MKNFKRELYQAQLAALRTSFDTFNAAGGCYLHLQTGELVYFARAVLLAIYGDHPAVCKVSLTGSSCPSCFTPRERMARAPITPHLPLRTEEGVAKRKRCIDIIGHTGVRGANTRALKKAKRLGVPMDLDSAFSQRDGRPWLFGPSEVLDSMYQALPQLTLHGFDEGIATKLCWAMLAVAIEEGRRKGIDATKVSLSFFLRHIKKSSAYSVKKCSIFSVKKSSIYSVIKSEFF